MTEPADLHRSQLHGDHSLCGWRVSSSIALPELPKWSGDRRLPEITFAVGPVPASLEPGKLTTRVLQIDDSGRCRFQVDGIAVFLIEEGRRITVDPVLPVDSPEIRLFLLGTPFGLLCHQRGILPLHAAAVEVDGEAAVLAGPSGIGKSTLAAAFLRRGHRILSDDVAPFELTDQGAMLLPSVSRIRLWKDTIAAAGWNANTMERCREGLEKFSRLLGDQSMAGPLQPGVLIHLERKAQSAGGTTFRRLRGREAADWARRQIYRGRSLRVLAGNEGMLRRTVRMTAAIPQHFVLSRPFDFAGLDHTVDMVVDTVRGMR